jgi:uncharacterized protein
MPEDLMRYDLLAQEALRGVVRAALRQVMRTGLPGDHHFYIAFDTRFPGVILSERLSQRYPREMTIVLQHQFWNLSVHEAAFEVELSFDNILEKLVIPFDAVKGFLDPSVQFGLQFETVPPQDQVLPKDFQTEPKVERSDAPAPSGAGVESSAGSEKDPEPTKVVSLDSFRKK